MQLIQKPLSEKGPAHKSAVLKLKKFKEKETFHNRLQPIFETERMSEKKEKEWVQWETFYLNMNYIIYCT